MTLVGVCDDCGYADGGHAPTCSRWQTMTEYERLKAQKDAILAKEKARGDALMKQLEGTLMGKLRQTEAERDALRAAAQVVADNMADESGVDPEIGYVIVLSVAEGNALKAALTQVSP